jgi:four helix bundle protein
VYAHHVSIALGSHGELETYFELASRLGFLSDNERGTLGRKADSAGRLLSALYRSLEEKIRAEKARRS